MDTCKMGVLFLSGFLMTLLFLALSGRLLPALSRARVGCGGGHVIPPEWDS